MPWSPIHSDVEEEENVKKNYDNREREEKNIFRQNVTPNHVNYKFRENVNISEFYILRPPKPEAMPSSAAQSGRPPSNAAAAAAAMSSDISRRNPQEDYELLQVYIYNMKCEF